MGEEESNQPEQLKVVDKRRFTQAGDVREGQADEQAKAAEPKRAKTVPQAAVKPASARTEPNTSTSALAQQGSKQQGSKPQANQQQSAQAASNPQAGDEPNVDFSSFVVGLATQVMMMLGEIPHPETQQLSVNLDAAKQTIDILAMLDEKTKGNLSADENQLLGEILSSLRMAFVHKSKTAKGA